MLQPIQRRIPTNSFLRTGLHCVYPVFRGGARSCRHFSLRSPESVGPRDVKLPLNQGEVSPQVTEGIPLACPLFLSFQ